MLETQEKDGGVLFAIKVAPRASADKLAGVEDGALKVRLTAPPVEGAANQALIKMLAKKLGVAKGRVRVAAGDKSRQKKLWVEGLDKEELLRRLGL